MYELASEVVAALKSLRGVSPKYVRPSHVEASRLPESGLTGDWNAEHEAAAHRRLSEVSQPSARAPFD
jgi:hypothetical protein